MKLKVVLKTNIPKLGSEGDVAMVSRGYALNYLLPEGMARSATRDDLAKFAKKQEKMAGMASAKEAVAREMKEKITKDPNIHFKAKTTDADTLYGKISEKEIAELVTSTFGVALDAKHVVLANPIKEVGEFPITLALGEGVEASFTLHVEKE